MSSPDPYRAPVGAPAPWPAPQPSPAPWSPPTPPPAPTPWPAPPYGPPPAAWSPYPYGSGRSALPHAPRPSAALALAALLTGVGSLVVGVPATQGVLGVTGGGVGVVLAAAALSGIGRGTARGSARAGWGLAISVLAIGVGVGVFALTVVAPSETAARAAGPGGPPDEATVDDAWNDGYAVGYDEGLVDGYEHSYAPVPAPGTADGVVAADDVGHLSFGETATLGTWSVTVLAVTTDADDAVTNAFPGNMPPVGRYVQATLAVTNTGSEPARPATDLTAYYWGDDGWMYGDWSCTAWTTRPVLDVGPVAPGASAEYDVCFDVPVAALDEATVLVDDAKAQRYDLVEWAAP